MNRIDPPSLSAGPGACVAPARLTRRQFVLGALGFGVSGCTDAPILQSTAELVRFGVAGLSDVPVSREAVDALPYASIRARVGGGGRAVLVLGRYAGDELHWISADRAVIATRHGRVTRTFGFARDLRETRDIGPDPLRHRPQALEAPVEYVRLIDIGPDGPYQTPVRSTLRVVGPEVIEILGTVHRTIRVREDGSAPQLNWTFESAYWVDEATGFPWRTIQYPVPGLGAVDIEVLKPARPA